MVIISNKWNSDNVRKTKEIHKHKPYQNIGCIVALIGFLLMLGSVGALEQNVIAFGRGVVQSVIGLVVFIIGAFIGDAIIGGEN